MRVQRTSDEHLGAAVLEVESRPGSCCFEIVGELDLSTSGDLEDLFDVFPGDGDIVFDLSRLRFVDVAGLRALNRIGEAARRKGRRLVLLESPPQMERIIALLGDCVTSLHLRPTSSSGIERARSSNRGRQVSQPYGTLNSINNRVGS
jgi:anti-anti-sigma factor